MCVLRQYIYLKRPLIARQFDGDEVAYLNTIGAYRQRLVTTDLTSPEAAEDEPAQIVQYARYQEIEKHMGDFLAMANVSAAR